MVQLTAQHNLSGEKLEFEKDRIETWKDVFSGQYFRISVSEEMHDKLDRWHEKQLDSKIRKWIATSMKPVAGLPAGKEGEAFQKDLELFTKIL